MHLTTTLFSTMIDHTRYLIPITIRWLHPSSLGGFVPALYAHFDFQPIPAVPFPYRSPNPVGRWCRPQCLGLANRGSQWGRSCLGSRRGMRCRGSTMREPEGDIDSFSVGIIFLAGIQNSILSLLIVAFFRLHCNERPIKLEVYFCA